MGKARPEGRGFDLEREDKTMICNNCGATIRSGSGFCETCGAALSRPSREQIRARIQGGPGGAARRPAPEGESSLALSAAGVVLALLQILFLLLKGAVKAPDYFTGEMVGYSLFDGSTGLCVLILLLSLCGGAIAALPLLGIEQPGVQKAAAPVALLNFILAIVALSVDVKRHTLTDTILGTGEVISQAKTGFLGVLFLILCFASLVVAVLVLLGAARPAARPVSRAPAAPAPRRTAVPAAAAPRRAPVRTAAPHPGNLRTGSAARPQLRSVTPPDAETIAALRRMAQMHDQGLISDQEFARIKAECVARGWIRG